MWTRIPCFDRQLLIERVLKLTWVDNTAATIKKQVSTETSGEIQSGQVQFQVNIEGQEMVVEAKRWDKESSSNRRKTGEGAGLETYMVQHKTETKRLRQWQMGIKSLPIFKQETNQKNMRKAGKWILNLKWANRMESHGKFKISNSFLVLNKRDFRVLVFVWSNPRK